MPDRMLQFVTVAQQAPATRAADLRRQDFAEIYAEYAPAQAASQASGQQSSGQQTSKVAA